MKVTFFDEENDDGPDIRGLWISSLMISFIYPLHVQRTLSPIQASKAPSFCDDYWRKRLNAATQRSQHLATQGNIAVSHYSIPYENYIKIACD